MWCRIGVGLRSHFFFGCCCCCVIFAAGCHCSSSVTGTPTPRDCMLRGTLSSNSTLTFFELFSAGAARPGVVIVVLALLAVLERKGGIDADV